MACCKTETPKCCETSNRMKQHLLTVVPMKNPLSDSFSTCKSTTNCCKSEVVQKNDCCKLKTCEEKLPDPEIIDTEGIGENDIDMVMLQSGANRTNSIIALKQHNNDVVDAISSLL